MRRTLLYLFCILGWPVLLWAQEVASIKIDGSINPTSAEFIQRSIRKAAEEHAQCLLIHLNTPGGLLKSTRVIVGDIIDAPLPVVVYVSPSGAHAGSAGVFITLAAHVAVMMPGTNMGAAHPVGMQGMVGDTIMNEKSTNDAAAFIRTIAEKRNRNVQWAEEAVRKSVAITATEALNKNIIDFVAVNERELLKLLDGRKLQTTSGIVTLHTSRATVKTYEMGFIENLLNILSDPNIAYILLLLGFYGIMFELYSPGAILPGIIGVISLILAFYSLHTLPINYAGLALIIFAIILFILEIKIVSHGMLAVGGILSLLLGSMMLIREDSGGIGRISWSVIISSTIVTAAFFLVVIGLGIKAQRAKPATGQEALLGETGVSLGILDPNGIVLLHGEIWKAVSNSGIIEKGAKIRVINRKGFTLYVERDV
ncbi:nodulation protein NfeD [Chitinophagaceae bacterium LB-8]|uniref:Nodulation protein NfeD n=1 Tax=Paraflavisolibacter caeni TaxID=2982496 RepID=A0A9X2XWG9_9BACT|nr:nodulation protein NfeD [Paraflavisolibacter caeni]MCU7550684.1 nodulation protein NfeD [Paraflavisolibacter caeni]